MGLQNALLIQHCAFQQAGSLLDSLTFWEIKGFAIKPTRKRMRLWQLRAEVGLDVVAINAAISASRWQHAKMLLDMQEPGGVKENTGEQRRNH